MHNGVLDGIQLPRRRAQLPNNQRRAGAGSAQLHRHSFGGAPDSDGARSAMPPTDKSVPKRISDRTADGEPEILTRIADVEASPPQSRVPGPSANAHGDSHISRRSQDDQFEFARPQPGPHNGAQESERSSQLQKRFPATSDRAKVIRTRSDHSKPSLRTGGMHGVKRRIKNRGDQGLLIGHP